MDHSSTRPKDHVERILAEWRQEFPDLATAPMGVIGRVRRLSTFFLRGMEETWAKFALTDRGRKLIEQALVAHVETQARLIGTLTPAEQDTLAALLKKMLADFEAPKPGKRAPAP